MKMRFARMLLMMVMALVMLMPCATAVQYVTFEDIPGEWNNYEAAVKWMNATYIPTSEHAFVDTDLLDGGEIAPGVLEFIADPAYAYENPSDICAYLYLDVPGDILYVSAFEGNWDTCEYMLLNCVATDGMYVDIFFPSFDKDGKLLATDRVYLYEYELAGEWHYECVTFYFRYDGEETRSFLPNESAPVEQTENVQEEIVVTEEVVDTEEGVVTEEVVDNEEVVVTEEVIITEGDEFSVGIIGGSDGPTSTIISGTDGLFKTYFGNVLEGVLNGADESAAAPVENGSDTEEIEVTQAAPEAAEEEKQEEPDGERGEKMFEFFSGVFGN